MSYGRRLAIKSELELDHRKPRVEWSAKPLSKWPSKKGSNITFAKASRPKLASLSVWRFSITSPRTAITRWQRAFRTSSGDTLSSSAMFFTSWGFWICVSSPPELNSMLPYGEKWDNYQFSDNKWGKILHSLVFMVLWLQRYLYVGK